MFQHLPNPKCTAWLSQREEGSWGAIRFSWRISIMWIPLNAASLLSGEISKSNMASLIIYSHMIEREIQTNVAYAEAWAFWKVKQCKTHSNYTFPWVGKSKRRDCTAKMHIRGVALNCKCRCLIPWMRMLVSTEYSVKFRVITAFLDSLYNTKKPLMCRGGGFFCVPSLNGGIF